MQANKITHFLGETSSRFHDPMFSVSIVDYHHFVSEDWHYHENVHLSSILAGGNRESRKAGDVQVAPGKIMAYRQGEIHRNTHTLFPSKNLNIELSPSFFNEELQFSNLRLNHDLYLSSLKIYHEFLLNDGHSQDSVQQILHSFFSKEATRKEPGWIRPLKCLLHDRWQEFISLEMLSKELKVHPVTISKNFAKHAKCTLADYMRKIKVERAVDLLFNSAKSLTEIAYVCGFSDQSHMYRLFRYYTGFSPKQLRGL